MFPPLALYVHVPWCVKKCPYCDFNSHVGTPQIDEYVNKLINEVSTRKKLVGNRPLISIYFGGGTPNLMPPSFYNRFLSEVSKIYTLSDNIEITLEANPGDGRIHDFNGYHLAGINRLSIGVQSFNNKLLKNIGRDYSEKKLNYCLEQAKLSPINNINLDLIFALPEQTIDDALNDVSHLLGFEPQHLSLYELTLEPNTVFYKKPPNNIPIDDEKAEYYKQIVNKVTNSFYMQYEVSAFALAGKESIHNLNYWLFGDYLAIGAGAHGKITNEHNITRYSNLKLPTSYLKEEDPTASQHILTTDNIFEEWCLNSFRSKNGVDLNMAESYTGIKVQSIIEKLNPIKEHITIENNFMKIKDYAFLRQNYLLHKIY